MATSWAAWPPAWSAIASMVAAYRVVANRIRRITASIRAICIRSHVDPCSSLSIRIIRLSFSTYPATLASRWSYSCRRKMCRQHFKVCSKIYHTIYIYLSLLISFTADVQHHGSLFTLFLHSPLTALCYICNVGDVPIHHWERCQTYVDRFITEASRLVTRCRIDEIEQGIGFIGELWGEVIKIIIELIPGFSFCRLLLCSVLRRRFSAHTHSSLCLLWCCAASASRLPWQAYEATLRTTTASEWAIGASIAIAHHIPIGIGTRCAWPFLRGSRVRLMTFFGRSFSSSHNFLHAAAANATGVRQTSFVDALCV